MDLKSWRLQNKLSLAAIAARLGVTGQNPGRHLQRLETGKHRADADFIAAIERLTGGVVDAAAMNATRLAWLHANNKARDFSVQPAEAAE